MCAKSSVENEKMKLKIAANLSLTTRTTSDNTVQTLQTGSLLLPLGNNSKLGAQQTDREVYHWKETDYGVLCEILKSTNAYTISEETLAKKLNEEGVKCTRDSLKSRLTRIKQGKIGSRKIGVEHYD